MNTEQPGRHAANPERRATLARLASLCGLALTGDVLAALSAPTKGAGLLAPDALALTGVLAELIIPRTDTPGALDVGAHRTISHLLRACAPQAAQAQFLAGLTRLDGVARAQSGKRFAKLPPARQIALLRALDASQAPFDADDQRFFMQLKLYTAFAYYTSEAGATRELAYLPVPGGFKRIPLEQVGRNWAL